MTGNRKQAWRREREAIPMQRCVGFAGCLQCQVQHIPSFNPKQNRYEQTVGWEVFNWMAVSLVPGISRFYIVWQSWCRWWPLLRGSSSQAFVPGLARSIAWWRKKTQILNMGRCCKDTLTPETLMDFECISDGIPSVQWAQKFDLCATWKVRALPWTPSRSYPREIAVPLCSIIYYCKMTPGWKISQLKKGSLV